MSRKLLTVALGLLVWALALGCSGRKSENPELRYRLIDLGTLGGGYSEAVAVNNRSQVAGYATVPSGLYHPFLYENGTMRDVGLLDGDTQGYAYDIDDAGRISGISNVTAENGFTMLSYRDFLYRPGDNAPQEIGAVFPALREVRAQVVDTSDSGRVVLLRRVSTVLPPTQSDLMLLVDSNPVKIDLPEHLRDAVAHVNDLGDLAGEHRQTTNRVTRLYCRRSGARRSGHGVRPGERR